MTEVIGFRGAHRLQMAAQMPLTRALCKNWLRLHHLLLKLIDDIDIIRHVHVGKLGCGA